METNKLDVKGIIKDLYYAFTNKYSTYRYSQEIRKDYNDLIAYLRNYEKNRNVDSDTSNTHTIRFEYISSPQKKTWREYTVTHIGNVATRLEIDFAQNGYAKFQVEDMFRKINKKVKDTTEPLKAVKPAAPAEDYNKYEINELLEVFDKKVAAFESEHTMQNLSVIKNIRKVIGSKIDEMPLNERGKFSKPLSNIDLYLNTLTTQLSNATTANLVGQFVQNYISQIRGSISEIASAL